MTLAVADDAKLASATLRARLPALSRLAHAVNQQTSARSVLLINSARGAVSLSVAVTVADLSGVEHGFWVVLGTLSVLRTSAAATGSTALRALFGTAVGFAVGAGLMLVVGSDAGALWALLPLAVAVAAYAPGAAPFAVGQAAFTVTIVVLFNLLVPVGWKVGEFRLLDVAIGCAVSVTVGLLLWPRGASALLGDDLAEGYRVGSLYLRQAVEWACGHRTQPPEAADRASAAAARLDLALRTFLAEQGSKRVAKNDLWRLIGGTLRLRLTARTVAGLPRDPATLGTACAEPLVESAAAIEKFCHQLARRLGPPGDSIPQGLGPPGDSIPQGLGPPSNSIPPRLEPPNLPDTAACPQTPALVWLSENVEAMSGRLSEMIGPAERLAETRRRPWWR